jgi:hypothetical protein
MTGGRDRKRSVWLRFLREKYCGKKSDGIDQNANCALAVKASGLSFAKPRSFSPLR